jgi:predicted transcriptional regulator of viral defense system
MDSAHALHFELTQDEINALKQIELTGPMPLATALKRHISSRLTEHGLLARGDEGSYVLTAAGREMIRRSEVG